MTNGGTVSPPDTSTGTGSSGSGSSEPVTTMPPGDGSSTGPPDMFVVIQGSFVDGGGMIDLPIQCRIRFYEVGQIEPSTGVELGGFVFQLAIEPIDEFPQAFTIDNQQATTVAFGQTGFVGAACDADDDGAFDDMIGGFFPDIPLSEVTVPAASVDIPIAPF